VGALRTTVTAETTDATAILKWLSRNTKPVSPLADSATARAVLTAAETLLDGTAAAPSTTRRNRAILHNAMDPSRLESSGHGASGRPFGLEHKRVRHSPGTTGVRSSVCWLPRDIRHSSDHRALRRPDFGTYSAQLAAKNRIQP
jgi:hypothetical protein